MTTRLAASALAVLLSVAAAGCRGRPELRPAPPGPDLENPSVPESVILPRPGPGEEGVYLLVEVNGRTIPAVVEERDGCSVSVVSGRLALDDGRFTATATGQEVCGGTAREPTTRRAEGRYRLDGAALRLTLPPEGPFGPVEVEAQVLSDRTIVVTRVGAGGRSREVSLRLRKQEVP